MITKIEENPLIDTNHYVFRDVSELIQAMKGDDIEKICKLLKKVTETEAYRCVKENKAIDYDTKKRNYQAITELLKPFEQ